LVNITTPTKKGNYLLSSNTRTKKFTSRVKIIYVLNLSDLENLEKRASNSLLEKAKTRAVSVLY
jgi:hypothetical protein